MTEILQIYGKNSKKEIIYLVKSIYMKNKK